MSTTVFNVAIIRQTWKILIELYHFSTQIYAEGCLYFFYFGSFSNCGFLMCFFFYSSFGRVYSSILIEVVDNLMNQEWEQTSTTSSENEGKSTKNKLTKTTDRLTDRPNSQANLQVNHSSINQITYQSTDLNHPTNQAIYQFLNQLRFRTHGNLACIAST